ncbi:MAG: response regulator transcription factor [Verrucomicrobiota bacterium]
MSAASRRIRIVLADDHTMFRQGLSLMVRSQTIYELVGEAKDGAEAWELIESLQPDVAVVDLSMPEARGIELIERAREKSLATKFILLTMHTHDSLVREAMRAGASGCVVKDDAFEDLESAIEEALAGSFFASRSLGWSARDEEAPGLLSPREKQILRGIIEGRTNKELAEICQVSIKTIETHRLRMMKKLGAHNTADIVRKGLEMGL